MNNKVIKVIDEEHGAKVIEFFKQYCDTCKFIGDSIGDYYGIINGKFGLLSIDEIPNYAKIIELPEEKIYPRVMAVSDDNIKWKARRVVFMEKSGGFLAWIDAETLDEAKNETETRFWNYAKEIEPIEVTMEEIAEWKGVSKEQIKIK